MIFFTKNEQFVTIHSRFAKIIRIRDCQFLPFPFIYFTDERKKILLKMTSWHCFTCWLVKLWCHNMTSLVNKSADWPPNYHKILIFSPPKSLKRLRAARIDELADSNKPAKIVWNVQVKTSNQGQLRFQVFQIVFYYDVIIAPALRIIGPRKETKHKKNESPV